MKHTKLFLALLFLLITALPITSAMPSAKFAALVSATQKKERIVYVTNTGEKYHRDGCRHLRKSKIAIKLSEAKAQGYTPCKVCRP